MKKLFKMIAGLEDSADSRGYVTLDIEPETEADESADSKVETSDSEESETKEA